MELKRKHSQARRPRVGVSLAVSELFDEADAADVKAGHRGPGPGPLRKAAEAAAEAAIRALLEQKPRIREELDQ